MKRIDIYGVRYCDIVLYLSRILQNLRYRVIICDRSISKTMRSFIPVFEEFDLNREIFDYAGIGYTYHYTGRRIHGNSGTDHDIPLAMVAEDSGRGAGRFGRNYDRTEIRPDDCEDYFDMMIVLNDATAAMADFWDEEYRNRDICLFITDEYPENVYEMKNALKAVTRNAEYMDCEQKKAIKEHRFFVVRDYTGTARSIIDDLERQAGASRCFLIPWSKQDRRLEMLAAYNDGFRFVGMSDRLCNLIEELCDGLDIDTSGSEYRRAFQKAGRGKRI